MKFLRLTYNEIYKQIKKKSFIITLLLIILFAISFPIINKITGSEETHNYDNYEIDYLKQSNINSNNAEEKEMYKEFVNIRIDGLNIRHEKDITESNYRYALVEEAINKKEQIKVIEYLQDEKTFNEIENCINKIDAFVLDISILKGLNNKELEELKSKLESEVKKIDKVVLNDEYMYFINSKIEENKSLLKQNKEEQKTVVNDTKLKNLKEEENKLNDILEVYTYLKEENVNKSTSLRAEKSEELLEKIETYYTPKLTKQDLASQGKMDYEEYEKSYEKNKTYLKEEINKIWYMIKQNKDYEKPGVKTSLDSSLSIIQLLGILVIIITGGIMSSEFSKGTIRLLVIRPNKRWKILLSKFLAFLLITMLCAILTTIICIVANGVVYGFSDYLTGSLVVNNNTVIEVSYLLQVFKESLILIIPIIFVGILTFMLSVITNSTAFSVGLGMAVMFAYTIPLQIMVMLNIPLVDFTFLPYLNYNIFLNGTDLYEYSINIGYNLSMIKGNIILLIWSIVFYFIASLVFIKRDIKN